MKPEHVSNVIAAVSALIAVIAIVVATSRSDEVDRLDIEKRLSALEIGIQRKADSDNLASSSTRIENLETRLNESRQQIGAKADLKDSATREDLVRMEGRWQTTVSGKTDLDAVNALVNPLRTRLSETESRIGVVATSLSSAKAGFEASFTEKTTGIQHSNASATGISGNLVVGDNKWDGKEVRKEVGKSKNQCPDGWYLVGIGGLDKDGGRYCTDCLTHIEFFCRQI